MNKPIPVKIVEVLGWMYVALAVLLILVLVISAVVAVDRDGEIWPLVLCGSFLLLLSLGMALSLRRGRRGWFLVPHTVILSLFYWLIVTFELTMVIDFCSTAAGADCARSSTSS